jgi:peptide/nickel transport system permease protein
LWEPPGGVHKYLIRRVLLAIPTLIGVTILIFIAMRVIPGDPIAMITSEGGLNYALSEEEINAVKHSLGLDRPYWEQYLAWMSDVLKGDLGYSFWRQEPIRDQILRRAPITIEIAAIAIALSWIIGLPVGMLSAIKRNAWPDYVSRVFVIFFVAVPAFWVALLVVLAGVMIFNWRPSLTIVYFWEDPRKNLELVLGPAIVLGIGIAALTARMTRSATLEILHEDFVRTARAKGLRERLVVMRHVLRNALLPVVTISGLAFGGLLGGSVAVERAFGVPGLGTLLVMGFGERDWMLIQNLVLLYGVVFTLINMMIDLTYGLLDPRIAYS